jgi:hypothetical protein
MNPHMYKTDEEMRELQLKADEMLAEVVATLDMICPHYNPTCVQITIHKMENVVEIINGFTVEAGSRSLPPEVITQDDLYAHLWYEILDDVRDIEDNHPDVKTYIFAPYKLFPRQSMNPVSFEVEIKYTIRYGKYWPLENTYD